MSAAARLDAAMRVGGAEEAPFGEREDRIAATEVMARAGGENFPVASFVLPRAARGHLMAIYGFARLVDELGDSAGGDR
ncbi:MAG: squalene/phytoene synthase family protein, partial [Solirubrobacteraceae bacterium]